MNKKLPTNDIANELSGSSVFFQSSTKPKPPQDSPMPGNTQESNQQREQLSSQATMQPRHHDTMASNHTPSRTESRHGIKPTRDNEDTTAATLETIRKVVRQIGKEAATHRFTSEEKRTLADIVYAYTRQGYKTSENEITRIAVNWLILDYQERGEQSVLARMLETLHK